MLTMAKHACENDKTVRRWSGVASTPDACQADATWHGNACILPTAACPCQWMAAQFALMACRICDDVLSPPNLMCAVLPQPVGALHLRGAALQEDADGPHALCGLPVWQWWGLLLLLYTPAMQCLGGC